MHEKKSYRKTERVTNRSDYKAIYNKGVWNSSQHFRSVICSNKQGNRRLGITVTKKAGNAVKRNRIKRLIREFFRLNKDLFPAGHDIIVMAKRNMPPLTYQEACRELTELVLRKANV
jgi:ribonuclease P protein component